MEKRLALITGGTSGIGFGAAKRLAPECDLALAYAADHEKAEKAKQELDAMGAGAKTYAKQLSSYDDAGELIEKVQADFGRSPDILVNSAGRIHDGFFLNTDFAHHESIIREHLIVTMAMCHLVIKSMYGNKSGRIINLSSISGIYAKRGQTSYAAAKAGIIGFTKTLAMEVAHRGITVNAVAPGLIDTPMTSGIIQFLEKTPDRKIKKLIPAGYVGEPDDVGSLIAYLCSEEARYITGAVITIDGGRSLGDTGS
ncbi:MAG TPA: SDR family oxidoreductase [Nitrospirae bacterium]|nr:3-oxoacyl-[acyl-carrier-protein] reductase FabG [bacterium BMS3Abin10]GBE38148.1 3-oxoacyl-[acyl-carrier-protein] reductase FabG [bacterium BMS3Bbin08]HDH49994.1 SDR family oxidoreductase [Nitrospirota bacterium]HDK17742.1 SDR family oxidoreductase [Nitrospirota bacterium]HDK82129.1 SDR family oxidoreductase [Nitrospirota bacterium]